MNLEIVLPTTYVIILKFGKDSCLVTPGFTLLAWDSSFSSMGHSKYV